MRVPSPPWPRGRLDGVVQAQHGRRRAAAQDPPAGLDAVGERRRTQYAARRSAGGSGWARSHTRVIDAERALGAEEQLGRGRARPPPPARRRCARPCRRRARPRGRRRCPRSCRSGCEYWPAPRQATQPPTVAMSKLCGKWPTRQPVALPQLALEVGAERAGEHLDDARRRRRRRRCRPAPVRSSTTPPNTGTDAPAHAAAPAGGGDRHAVRRRRRARRRRPRSVDRRPARPTAARCGTSPASAQCIASGHQSRLASAVAVVVGDASARRRAARRAPRRRRRSTARRPGGRRCRSARSAAVGLASRDRTPSRSGSAVASGGRSAAHEVAVSRRPGGRSRRRPSRARRRAARRRRRAPRASAGAVEQVGPGAPGEHVVERRRHLVADGVHGLGAQVRQARRRAARRASGRRRRAPRPRRRACRSGRRGGPPACPRGGSR